jgi:hypothetical protein
MSDKLTASRALFGQKPAAVRADALTLSLQLEPEGARWRQWLQP